MSKKLTTEEYICKAKNIHGDKYDYSKTVYLGNKKKIIVGCKIHGFFETNVGNHINLKTGCPKCKNKTEHEIMLKYNYYRIYDCGNIKYTYEF